MGFFKSSDEKDLGVAAEPIGTAVAKVALGQMPPDFVDFSIAQNRLRCLAAYRSLTSVKGEEFALRSAVKAARRSAEAWFSANNVNQVRDCLNQTEVAIKSILDAKDFSDL